MEESELTTLLKEHANILKAYKFLIFVEAEFEKI